jgi:hypothetical protein
MMRNESDSINCSKPSTTSRVRESEAARNMVTLHNLPTGLYNRLRVQEKTKAPSLPSWRRSMKGSEALRHIMR